MRYKICLEYEGTPYCGWQRQKEHKSVQEALEDAIKKLSGQQVSLIAAGRTDAGVHAKGQVAHFDLAKDWQSDRLRDGLNAHLRDAEEKVFILAVEKVPDHFNARFDAEKRHYLYKILNRRAPPALDEHRVWWVPKRLDVAKMHEAAQYLIGHHDFTTFRAVQCQAKSPLRSLDRLDVVQKGEIIEIYASARSFLHHQIRSFAGSLVEVGCGRWQSIDMKKALLARDRKCCGQVAPSYGLYFMRVDYPVAYQTEDMQKSE